MAVSYKPLIIDEITLDAATFHSEKFQPTFINFFFGTRSEIEYATATGKPVRYLEPMT